MNFDERASSYGSYNMSAKVSLYAGLAHNLNIYQYLDIKKNKNGSIILWCKTSVLEDFGNARQECYDKDIIESREALHEAIKYKRKWDIKKAAMYVLCAREMDGELKAYTDNIKELIYKNIRKTKSNIRKQELFDSICYN